MVGRRLLLGAPPGVIGEDALALLRRTGAMGLVLFRSNLTQPAQLRQHLTWLRECLGRPVVIAIDHEGGQVMRHLEGTAPWPGNYALGRVAEQDVPQAERWAEQVGWALSGGKNCGPGGLAGIWHGFWLWGGKTRIRAWGGGRLGATRRW
jgi:beta-N-acetylhexosaminidase